MWFSTTNLPLCFAGDISAWYSGTLVLTIATPIPEMILPTANTASG